MSSHSRQPLLRRNDHENDSDRKLKRRGGEDGDHHLPGPHPCGGLSRAWSGMSTRQYKNLKGLKKENLRDNMTTLELVLNMLAEATTTEISKQKAPESFSDNIEVARAGGKVAGDARKAIELQTGVPVITEKNAAQLNQVITDLIEGGISESEVDSSKQE